MFNRGKYSLQRYNIIFSTETDVLIETAMLASLLSIASNGENVFIDGTLTVHFDGSAYGTSGTIYSGAMETDLVGRANGCSEYILLEDMIAGLFESVSSGEDCYIVDDIAANLSASAFAGSDEYIVILMDADLAGNAIASVDYAVSAETMQTILLAVASSNIYNYKYISIDIVIPAGGTLIIDSDNYEVLLNGVNVINRHSGDWLDNLARETYDIQLLGGPAANLTGSILYTPRWL